MTEHEEASEIEGEEDLNELVDIITFYNSFDDCVGDKKLDDHIDCGEAQNEPLVAISAENTQSVEEYDADFLQKALIAHADLVFFEGLVLLFLSHELLGLS